MIPGPFLAGSVMVMGAWLALVWRVGSHYVEAQEDE